MSEIKWPEKYDPSRAPIYIKNEVLTTASPENIWSWLVHAHLWPTYYPESKNVRIAEGKTALGAGVKFTWNAVGVNLRSEVLEWVPHERIAWNAHGIGVDAYHAWLIKKDGNGTHFITEETQYGFLARLGKFLMPSKMQTVHQMWLENLAEKAKSGPAPTS